jgi:hypothetical protein
VGFSPGPSFYGDKSAFFSTPSKGVRGKYYDRMKAGTNDPNVAKGGLSFPPGLLL